MALYDRLLGIDADNPKIAVQGFSAVVAEYARGVLTGLQVQDAIAVFGSEYGFTPADATISAPLTASETTEVQTLLATVTGTAEDMLARAKEIADVLILAEHRVAEYDTAAEVQTRLGV